MTDTTVRYIGWYSSPSIILSADVNVFIALLECFTEFFQPRKAVDPEYSVYQAYNICTYWVFIVNPAFSIPMDTSGILCDS